MVTAKATGSEHGEEEEPDDEEDSEQELFTPMATNSQDNQGSPKKKRKLGRQQGKRPGQPLLGTTIPGTPRISSKRKLGRECATRTHTWSRMVAGGYDTHATIIRS